MKENVREVTNLCGLLKRIRYLVNIGLSLSLIVRSVNAYKTVKLITCVCERERETENL
jgi:hypothetical protein